MCVYRGSAGGAAEMNEPHPSLLGHHSLTSDDIPRIHPSIHPSPATVYPQTTYRPVLSSPLDRHIASGGGRSKCKNCQLADQFPSSPWGGPSTASAGAALSSMQQRISLSQSHRGLADGYKNPQQIWGFGWLHLNWLYLSKMLFMTHS